MKRIWDSVSQYLHFAEQDKKQLTHEIASRACAPGGGLSFGALPNPDPILKAAGIDISAYRDLRSDPLIGSAIRRRKAAVKKLTCGFTRQADSPVCEFLTQMMDRWNMDRIIGSIMDAPLYGWQPAEVMWGQDNGKLIITDIIAKPHNWFFFTADNELRFREKNSGTDGMALSPMKFLCPVQDGDFDNPYGFPDLSMCFWPALFKKHGWKFWMYFTEKYGTPWIVGKHRRGESQDNIDQLMAVLERMVQDAVAAIPDDSSVEILEASGKTASSQIYREMIEMARSEISIALLGQNQTTEADVNRASATAGLEVTDDIRDGDASLVMATINQVLGWAVTLNFGETTPLPRWEMWEQQEVDEVQARRDLTLSQTRAFFTDAYYQRQYGIDPGDLQPYTPATPLPFAPGQPAERRVPQPLPAEFAEAASASQETLDTLLDSPDDGGQLTGLLAPLFAQVRDGAAPEELLDRLADIYPQMDDSELTEKLGRLMFLAHVLGRVHDQQV